MEKIDLRGEPCLLSVTNDVTERKQAEKALQRSEEELRLMFESVTDGVMVTDLNAVITKVNHRIMEMHGTSSSDDFLGKSAFDFIASRDCGRAKVDIPKTLESGLVESIKYTLLRKDGSELPGELSISMLKDASGNPVGFIGSFETSPSVSKWRSSSWSPTGWLQSVSWLRALPMN